ncbi:ATP-grasp domain-containing protein [Xanthomonas hydrangeae]|uniref:ATP-grasp domain-containing protein n=1 Tax=Xanthomonas hydrangeae TaxID=2775159 RepID=A0AAU0B6X3_9XANT|nr:ATP-grasp domain-containing protein [Xanthomonas hydrangeae]WOB47944.1 ATP-grasp domain-containing protein [Xanthomonas hydrangeae]
MSYALMIGGRTPHTRVFHDIHGRSILSRFPGRVLLFLDAPTIHDHGPNVTVEVITYMEYERALHLAREYHQREGISSISTLGEDSIEFVADLREALGVVGMLPKEAKLHRDKVAMKQRLRYAGMRVPNWSEAADTAAVLQLADAADQVVMKPRDGQGSRQVAFLRGREAVSTALQRCRNPESFEVEEYIDGCLYHTNSVVIDGQLRFTAIAQYVPGMGNIDYTRGSPFVCLMEPDGALHARLLEYSRRVIEALGLRNGVTHMELFHSNNDEIVFCETAIRPGGGGIVHMIEAQYGINMSFSALLVDAGHGDMALDGLKDSHPQMGLIGLRNTKMGTVQVAEGWDQFSMPWVQLLEITIKPGDFRPPSSHCTDFTALAILAADGQENFHERITQISDHFDRHLRLV